MTPLRIMLEAWLAAAMVWLWVPVGALALLLLDRLFATGWSRAQTGALAAVAAALPVMAAAFVPVLFGLGLLYPWVAAPKPEQTFWLTPWFFAGRAVLCLAVWWGLMRWAIRPGLGRGGAAAGLIVLSLTGTVAAMDWMMSLAPEFASSAFGLMVLTAAALAGFAAALGLWLGTGPVRQPLSGPGALLLTLVLGWGYVAFMQYLVVWSGNKPSLAVWYLARAEGVWAGFAWGMVLLKGVVPFVLLLFPPVRRSSRMLAVLCLLILVGHGMDILWLVLPAFSDPAVWSLPASLLLTVLFGLAGGAVVRRRLPRLAEGGQGHG